MYKLTVTAGCIFNFQKLHFFVFVKTPTSNINPVGVLNQDPASSGWFIILIQHVEPVWFLLEHLYSGDAYVHSQTVIPNI